MKPLYEFISASAFARLTGVRYPVVLRMCQEGELPSYVVGLAKKHEYRLPKELALEALDKLLRAPLAKLQQTEAEPQTSAGEIERKEPLARKMAKVYQLKRRKTEPATVGTDFKSSMKALLQ